MTGFDVYKTYLALKLHFTKDKYNYFTFNGKSRASQSAFDKRKDRYFFKKLAAKFDHDTVVEYFLQLKGLNLYPFINKLFRGKLN